MTIKNMKTKIFIILLMFVLMLSGCSNNNVNLSVDPNAKPISQLPQKEEMPKTVAIPGWEIINLPANRKEVYMEFYNPIENENLYYLTFEWRLLSDNKEDYEILYKSDLIAPGEHTEYITLNKELDIGNYETIIFVQPYKMNENKTPTNNATIKTTLIMK